jgi:hypothetical protein
MNRHLPRALATVAFLAPALSLGAQQTRTLTKPDAEFADPFTQLNSVRELRDARVIAADTRDKTVQLIDFRSGSAVKIGREGQGPGEYALPARLLAFPGDTTALYDQLNARYLLIGPDGKTGKDFRLDQPQSAAPGGGRVMMIGSPPRGTDARGRIYYEAAGFSMSADGVPQQADTAPIIRYDRATARSDTIAFVKLPQTNTQASGGRDNRMVMRTQVPFAPRDEWAVFPDGRVVVVRVADYHVDAYSAVRAKTAGPAVKFERLPVTEGDKQEFRDARKSAVGMTVRVENGVTSRGAGPLAQNLPDPEFPAFKPPFPQGAALARPNGELWVARSRKAGAKVWTYDVFDATGTVRGQLTLPPATRVVGFGNGTVYTVRTDSDDLQYLGRFTFKEGPILP